MTRIQKAVAVLAALLVLLLAFGVLRYDKIDVLGSNMAPTLEPGETVVIRSGASPQVNDIVLFNLPSAFGAEERLAISRVIAVGGQEIRFQDGDVFINDVLVNEPFVAQSASTAPRQLIPGCAQEAPEVDRCRIPDGSVFLMGDNRTGSSDSRSFGPVTVDEVRGVVTGAPFWLPEFLVVG